SYAVACPVALWKDIVVIPCDRRNLSRWYNSSSFVTIMPPSPVLIFLFEKKLKHPISPIVPSLLPRYSESGPWHASSIILSLYFLARFPIASILQGKPAKWTTTIALVLTVISVSISRGLMLKSSSEITSQKTGVAPTYLIALTLATKVNDGQITSSPGLIPSTSNARCNAAVQFVIVN